MVAVLSDDKQNKFFQQLGQGPGVKGNEREERGERGDGGEREGREEERGDGGERGEREGKRGRGERRRGETEGREEERGERRRGERGETEGRERGETEGRERGREREGERGETEEKESGLNGGVMGGKGREKMDGGVDTDLLQNGSHQQCIHYINHEPNLRPVVVLKYISMPISLYNIAQIACPYPHLVSFGKMLFPLRHTSPVFLMTTAASCAKSRSLTSAGFTDMMAKASLSSLIFAVPTCGKIRTRTLL